MNFVKIKLIIHHPFLFSFHFLTLFRFSYSDFIFLGSYFLGGSFTNLFLVIDSDSSIIMFLLSFCFLFSVTYIFILTFRVVLKRPDKIMNQTWKSLSTNLFHIFEDMATRADFARLRNLKAKRHIHIRIFQFLPLNIFTKIKNEKECKSLNTSASRSYTYKISNRKF